VYYWALLTQLHGNIALVPAVAAVAVAAVAGAAVLLAAEVAATVLPTTCRQSEGCHNMFCRCLGPQWRPNQAEGRGHQGRVVPRLAGAPQRHVGVGVALALPHSAAAAVRARIAAENNNSGGQPKPRGGLGC